MGIEKIKNKFEGNSSTRFMAGPAVKNRIYLGEIKDSTSFTGTGAATATAVRSINDILLDIMPKSAKRMVKMHEGMGEIQNQFINALGTGLVAPLFIKFNPLSDTDENTRTYTAWRQPVSAVLAVGTQCAIVKPFNDLIRWMSDIGYLGQKYNSTLNPSDNYIKRLIKEENPNKKYTKDEMEAAIKERKKTVYDPELEKMISNDKITFKKSDVNGISTFDMPDKDFKALFNETIDKIIKGEEQQRKFAIEEKLPSQIERNIFYHNHPEESRNVLQRISGTISKSYSESGVDNGESCYKDIQKECKKIISDLKAEMKSAPEKKDTNNELIKIVKELREKLTDKDSSSIRILDNKINKMLENINLMASKKTTKEIIDHVNNGIYMRTSAIDGVISTLQGVKDQLNSTGITVKEAQARINEVIEESAKALDNELKAKGYSSDRIKVAVELKEGLSTRLKYKAGNIAHEIAEQLKKHTKSNIDGFKRWTGLGVSLAILPVTCWMLNKIYPWFMDLAFPELSNKQGKKNAGTPDAQKAEVK